MKVAIVTIAYSSANCVRRLAESANSCLHQLEFHIFLHSKDPNLVQVCTTLSQGSRVVYYPYGCNRGVSKSWNDGVLAAYARSADVVVVANDDIEFSRDDVDKIVAKAVVHRDRYIVSCAGFHSHINRRLPSLGYSCFAINPIALERIGCFDENLFPAYCEDQDYSCRAALAGLREENCSDTIISHVGSSAIMSDPALARQNELTQGRNLAYYRRKWGGDRSFETFQRPFNDPRLTYYIDPENRPSPYGLDYDRSDQDVVKL